MQLPVINYEEMVRGENLEQLDEACRQWGFFKLENPPLSLDSRLEMIGAMEAFFSLPLEEKKSIERTEDNHWGFYDQELTKNVEDWKEIFDVGPEQGSCIPQWPAHPAGFQSLTSAYYGTCEAVALEIVGALAKALGARSEELVASFSEHTSYLRLNYYPTCPDPSPADTPTGPPNGHFAISHHSDAGAVTVLLMDGVDSLQVEKDGQWNLAEANRGDWIINIGDVVQVWSNDRYKAPLHRVLANDKKVRYSAPFFLNPSFDATYAPLENALGGEEPRYRPIHWGEFRAGRAAGDYANVGEEIQIAHYRIRRAG